MSSGHIWSSLGSDKQIALARRGSWLIQAGAISSLGQLKFRKLKTNVSWVITVWAFCCDFGYFSDCEIIGSEMVFVNKILTGRNLAWRERMVWRVWRVPSLGRANKWNYWAGRANDTGPVSTVSTVWGQIDSPCYLATNMERFRKKVVLWDIKWESWPSTMLRRSFFLVDSGAEVSFNPIN